MFDDLLELVCCPDCRADLKLDEPKRDANGEILQGTLTCVGCARRYPIEDGIPNLLPPEVQED